MAGSRHISQEEDLAAWRGTWNASASCTAPFTQLQLAGRSKRDCIQRMSGPAGKYELLKPRRLRAAARCAASTRPWHRWKSFAPRRCSWTGLHRQGLTNACSMHAGQHMSLAWSAGAGVLQQQAAVQAAAMACIRHVEETHAAGKAGLGCTTVFGADQPSDSSPVLCRQQVSSTWVFRKGNPSRQAQGPSRSCRWWPQQTSTSCQP